MKKTILLTGATGAVGEQTLLELLKQKETYDIVAFDLDTPEDLAKFTNKNNTSQ